MLVTNGRCTYVSHGIIRSICAWKQERRADPPTIRDRNGDTSSQRRRRRTRYSSSAMSQERHDSRVGARDQEDGDVARDPVFQECEK